MTKRRSGDSQDASDVPECVMVTTLFNENEDPGASGDPPNLHFNQKVSLLMHFLHICLQVPFFESYTDPYIHLWQDPVLPQIRQE